MNQNPLGMKRFGPVVFKVFNAEKATKRLSEMLCMDIAYIPAGKEQIYGLKADDTIFIIDGSSQAQKLFKQHGCHISDIGIYVNSSSDALTALQSKTSNEYGVCKESGASYVSTPHDGGVRFRFIEDGQLPYPGIKENSKVVPKETLAFKRIDHIVTNTQNIRPVIEFFRDVFGMEKVNEFTIKVETESFSASLFSEVMGIIGTENEILFPVNEPLEGDTESQIPTQLKNMGRSHIQHVALATDNIISSIEILRQNGLGFLEFRNEEHAKRYYQSVPERLGDITVSEAQEALRALGILVDKCGEGYLLQLFSKRLFPERSVPFVEIIQRASNVVGCFGDGNFAALAESLEHAMRERQKNNKG